MPELPEIESVCKVIDSCLRGHRISGIEVTPDQIVFKGVPTEEIEKNILDKTVVGVGRKGKYFWVEFEGSTYLLGHLGMSGWVERLEPGQESPRFAKLRLDTEQGSIVITDMRRLGRIWLSADPTKDRAIKALGYDAYRELPGKAEFHRLIVSRKAPIKAILLDQKLLAGVGNYLADEVLYQAHISPHREANSLSEAETSKLRAAISNVIQIAVEVGADETRFPENWLFHQRWGGKRGADKIGKHAIVRDTVGGRTTAWVPSLQK